MFRDLTLRQYDLAALSLPRALAEVEFAGSFMLEDSRVLYVDLTQAVLAAESELCEHVPYHFVRPILELWLLTALQGATVDT